MSNTNLSIGANKIINFVDVGLYQSHLSGIYDSQVEREIEYLNDIKIWDYFNKENKRVKQLLFPTEIKFDDVTKSYSNVGYDDISEDSLDKSYKEFKDLVVITSQHIADEFCRDFKKITDYELTITVKEIRSPREYNFTTDVLDCEITINNIEKLKSYILKILQL